LTGRLFALALLVAACDGEANARHRAEAESVIFAVRQLRDADNADKGSRLATLRESACSAEDVCALKRECIAAYALYVKGLDSVQRVKRSLAADADLPAAKESASLLDSAQKDVEKGRELATECAKREATVAVAYKVR
jgi:hypothetical protein